MLRAQEELERDNRVGAEAWATPRWACRTWAAWRRGGSSACGPPWARRSPGRSPPSRTRCPWWPKTSPGTTARRWRWARSPAGCEACRGSEDWVHGYATQTELPSSLCLKVGFPHFVHSEECFEDMLEPRRICECIFFSQTLISAHLMFCDSSCICQLLGFAADVILRYLLDFAAVSQDEMEEV